TKLTAEIDTAERVPEIVSRAFFTASAGRPGPVVIALPKDMLGEPVWAGDAAPFRAVETAPDPADIAALGALLAQSKRPLLVLGGSRWDEASRAAVPAFADRLALPVMTSYRRAPLFDALHRCYAGDLGLAPSPKLIARVKAADLVVWIGGRIG